MTLVEDVAARLRAQVPSRAVYELAVPDGPLPTAYLLLRAAPSDEAGQRMTDTTDHVMWTVRVLSVARHVDPFKAARTAGSIINRAALDLGWTEAPVQIAVVDGAHCAAGLPAAAGAVADAFRVVSGCVPGRIAARDNVCGCDPVRGSHLPELTHLNPITP